MAHTTNRGWFMLDADASPAFQPASRDGGMGLVEGTAIIWWHQSGTTWNRIDLSTLAGPDGNNYVISRGNATANVAPTAAEAPVAGLAAGDTANVYLNNGQMEYWAYNGTAWVLGYTLTAQQLSDALTILSGVPANSTDLGTFTGTTIGDNLTIKAAIQALETALEILIAETPNVFADTNTVDLTYAPLTRTLTADVKISATQNNVLTVVADTDGLQVNTAAAPTYTTFALAQADAGLLVGDLYALTVNNLEGVPSNGSAGPFFRKA